MGIDSGLLSIRIFLANFTVKNGQKNICDSFCVEN